MISTENISCADGELEEAPFDPFSITIGDAQLEPLRATKNRSPRTKKSSRNSAKETARHGPKDFRDQDLDKDQLIQIVKDELKSRGCDEIAGIRSTFRRADKNG